MPIGRWTDKENALDPDNGLLFRLKKEGTSATRDNVGGPGRQHAE